MTAPFKDRVVNDFKAIQQEIVAALEAEDSVAKFEADVWERPGGGGGTSMVIQEGSTFEKGGVNFSAVHGELPEVVAKEFGSASAEFFATGVSIVIHPQNPWVPIIHMNIRYFEMPGSNLQWFGGGIDLTPHYINKEEAAFFHSELKNTCDAYGKDLYPKYKQWADDYFFIKHRNETRGIGGIFFDKLKDGNPMDLETTFEFVKAVGRTFPKVYVPLVQANKSRTFSESNKQWQKLRRGRYVEFNLVYDRGTKFGLETNGRIESILMSLPKEANWIYNYQTEPNSNEEETLGLLRKGVEWVR